MCEQKCVCVSRVCGYVYFEEDAKPYMCVSVHVHVHVHVRVHTRRGQLQ